MTDPGRQDDYCSGHPDDVRPYVLRRLQVDWFAEAKAPWWVRVWRRAVAQVRRLWR